MNNEDRQFYQGVALGVATLARRGEDSLAWDIMQSNGISLKDFEQAKVSAFDMKPIRRMAKFYSAPEPAQGGKRG